MVQIIEENRRPSFAQSILGGISEGIAPAIQYYQNSQREKERKAQLKNLTGIDAPEEFQKMQFASQLENQGKGEQLKGQLEQDEQNYNTIKDAFGNKFANVWKSSPTGARTELLKGALDAKMRGYDIEDMLSNVPEHQTTVDENIIPDLSKKPKGLTTAEWTKEKRKELYEVNKPILKELGELRKNIPLQEQAINDIKTAAPGVGLRDWIADTYGFEPLRSESGVKLKTAVKDFFLSDLTRAGARPNQWIEQQLASALPTIGRNPESNLITAAGLEFKVDLAKKRSELIDELSEKYGNSSVDLDRTASKMMKSYVSERQKLLEDQIKGIKNKYEQKDLSGRFIDVIGPDGQTYEVDESEAEQLPEGYRII